MRAERRAQNAMNIVEKLAAHARGDLSLIPRKRALLEHALGFLTSYADRHPIGEAAVQKHIWIKFGLNYESVMWLRNMAQPR